jgi:hypothetical protein
MTRTLLRASVLVLVLTGLAVPASAQVVHSVSFGAGIFWPKAYDTRVDNDVWVANLTQPVIPGTVPASTSSLQFNIKDFRAYPIFGEWHMGFGSHIEIGIGAAFQDRKVASTYADLVNGETSPPSEIRQDLRLRQLPITGVVRFLAGHVGGFQPYAGGGVVASIYRYSEVGEFVDTTTFDVYPASYVAKGLAFGPLILGGLRMPIGGDVYAINIEGRYQWLVGKTDGTTTGANGEILPDFLGNRIDLGGGSLNFSFLIRF